jgi:DNA-binding CsgD family transcriptional regulator
MQDVATRTLEALGMLYATASGSGNWPRALDAISEVIGSNGALLFVRDEGPAELQISAASTRYLAADIEQYLKSLVKDEEARWLRVLDELPPRTIQSDADIWPDRDVYDAMPSVRFLRGLHLYNRVAVRPCAHGGWKDSLALLFDDPRGGVQPAESHRLSLLVPHLARAIEMQRPFQLLQHRFGSALTLLDRLGIGVIIAREAGEIVLSNREADRILDAQDGLSRDSRSKIVARDSGARAQLGAALRRAERAARLEAKAGDATIEVPRRTKAERYVVDVAPFRDGGSEIGTAFVGVLLVLIDPDHREMVSVQGLARSYGLTQTETLVCRLIAQGIPLRQIAEMRGVSLDTVKSQSRTIYGKTQTRNRRELVRRALSIVPPLLDRGGKRIN